ncbi:MAG: hypothetical protein UY81_C0008G0012 [Candidatus Giovannonibacteria bacterium GW2011_GWA2_53_7]|uniref:Phosphoglycerate mutase n=1 Tax=Candidatus Giovannonibacteria bacterium GW2011_GWA2_53_7 TaxID=1618650 RepID=A0A0G1Y1C2_9BACT|nr:MAG: hypothetical protein UY81_C0008G0012 [Candidatus Giovannonibacteria bacterium GW2011_GWA2_53_7]
MDQPFVSHILCLRHGKTRYTGVFPDLTEEGGAHIQQVAHAFVKPWMIEHKIDRSTLEIVSSPAPRAQGTADVVTRVVGHIPVVVCKNLGAMEWRDGARARAALEAFNGKGYVDYETEPVFGDATIFETREEVRDRWYTFLAGYIRSVWLSKSPQHAIMVSHYEVLQNVVYDLFGIVASAETALQHGEPILLSVSFDDLGRATVSGRFRDVTAIALFDHCRPDFGFF